MAADYTELKAEIESWLDKNYAPLTAAIPTMIQDAENTFNRRLRTWDMECSSRTPLVPNNLVEADRGVYGLPVDWVGHRTVRRDGTDLRIVYYRRIPALTDQAPTNWLLAKQADLYRIASLASAESWLKNDPRIALWKGQRDEIMLELSIGSTNDEYSGRPLRTKTSNDRIWRMLKRTDGAYEFLSQDDFFDLTSSGYNQTQLGIQKFGYFTISHGNIHIWPKPAGDPTGDAQWSACP